MKNWLEILLRLGMIATIGALLTMASNATQKEFDQNYSSYRDLLNAHVRGSRVDYMSLAKNQPSLDRVAEEFNLVSNEELKSWSPKQQLAYWINAYNLFTLYAIVDHYPIRGNWFSWHPRNSIRQIDGIWDELLWPVGGRKVTLDQIEHEILRPIFKEPRIHFAINCASISCPPLATQPYSAVHLDTQLDTAARNYLATPHGLEVNGSTLTVTSIFDWYGDDFIKQFADHGPDNYSEKERAILAVIAEYGPSSAVTLAKSGVVKLGYLDYDWSLNDTATENSSKQ
jgi:hypothetical protein